MNLVSDFLRRSVRKYPKRTALIDGDVRFTYGELFSMVQKVAAGIQSLGVGPGERISYHGNNRWELVVTLLASIEAGTILVPLNIMLRPAELEPILRETTIRLVFTTAEGAAVFHELSQPSLRPSNISSYDDSAGLFAGWLRADAAWPTPVERGPDDILALFYTSGTTGLPKGAPISHEFVDHLAHSWIIACRYTPEDVFLVLTPMFWTVAPIHCVLPMILAAGTIVLGGRFEVARCCEFIKRYSVTSLFGVPTMYTLLLDNKREELSSLTSLRVCSVAGAPVAAATVEEFERLTGAALLNIYGATEAGAIARDMLGARRRPGYAGPWGGTVEAKIVDSAGNIVPDGVSGEIVVRGYTVIRGYWRDGGVDPASLPDGWFYTGDIGVMDAGFLQILDRAKDMIITGGANIYPAEIEAVLRRHPSVSLSAVIGLPDRVKGEVPIAYVIPKSPDVPSARELDDYCRMNLSSYKVPRQYVFVESLPMTPTGKIQKNELRKMAAASLPDR